MARDSRRPSPAGPGDLVRTVSWMGGDVVFEHRRFTAPRLDLTSPSTAAHRLVLTESGQTSRTRVAVEGRTIYDGFDRPGALTFVPAHVERQSSYWHADMSFSCLWISPAVVRGLEDRPASPVVNGDDDVVRTLLRSLRALVAGGGEPGALYVEHLAALAVFRMTEACGGAAGAAPAGRLDQGELRSVLGYIDANLAATIRLSDLAGLLGLATDTFARRFRATVGQPPYDYVLGRRVERSTELLRTTETDLSSIALDVGFSSQSHFTSAFKRLVGATPLCYREAYRPRS